ncbi:T9SS type A sorting domain-containing protein [Oceanihabitans sediminis]|uniref:T9SS type A sorting domain-containing protein n=1 Tax=Oceanihabitans sediminis TaxID=1812012 RepID=UPI00299E5136|nr:T9SS type A sorting domain-containing protein [Oceanihabitans sediminis]MDX1773827.1 T9SS type A sorting domain-containing protein [Oceanihabitans sediminis]
MKYLQYLLLIAVFYFINPLFSQTGPGGVGNTNGTSDLVLWLNPDQGINSNRVWKDQSGFGYDFTAGSGAVLNANRVNGYNAYTFNGTNQYFEKSFESDLNPNEFSVFSASKVLPSSNHKAILSSRNEYKEWWQIYSRKRGFILYSEPNTNNWSFWTGEGNDWRITGDNQSTAGSWSVQNINYRNRDIGKRLLVNSNLGASSSQRMEVNSETPFRIGTGKNEDTPDYFFKGDIGEVIMYKTVINEAQRIIVNNYLAAKYGFSINVSEDFYKQDEFEKGNYDHHVAGVGKAIDGSVHLESQGTGIVRIKTSSSLPNNSFLFWGEKNKNASYNFSTNSNNFSEQLNSYWRVSKAGGIGNVSVSFDRSKINLSAWDACKELQLVVANNSNFTSPTVYPLSIVDGFATATNVNFNDNDFFTIRYVSQIVWNGNQFYNGSRANQAPNNDSDKCLKLLVKAGNKAVLTENAYIKEIEVEVGAVLEVANGVELTVDNAIINNGTIDLLGEAQLIQKHIGSNANSGTGKLKIRQQGTTNLYNYNYWSAPVNRMGAWKVKYLEDNSGVLNFSNQHNANPVTRTLSSRWLYTFNGFANNYSDWEHIGINKEVLPGVGYTMKGSGATNVSNQEYVFSGEANSGDYHFTVVSGNEYLVGNPYPSALDASRFITENLSTIDGTLYFYEQFETNNTHVLRDYQGGYAVRNLLDGVAAVSQLGNGGSTSKGAPTNNIAVGQGFYVNVANNGTLKFNNQQRVFAKESFNESIFYRENTSTVSNDTRIKFWLNLTDSSGLSREILLGYDSNTTAGIDKGYDAVDFNNYPDYMLWDTSGELLVIQALPSFNIEDSIPLSIKITTAGTYTIGLDRTLNFPENTAIYLKDIVGNRYYDLKTEAVSIPFQAGTFNNQYAIVYQQETLSLPSLEENQSVSVKYDKHTASLQLFGLDNLSAIKSAYIYSIDGKQIQTNKNLDSKVIPISNLSDGVYILKLEMISGAVSNIKFVKR